MLRCSSKRAVNSTSTAIPFEGCSLFPNSPIKITAGNPSPLNWDVLATTTAPSKISYTDSLKYNWYCWSVNVTIPERSAGPGGLTRPRPAW